MLKKIQERIFPFLIATSALSVSASAAFYSVSGLSKLFAGASLAVVIMATTLEASKLVIASLLYQYRKTLPRTLKIYLTIAAAILILITSMGIYGFLSAAYQETANKSGYVEKEVSVINLKKQRFEENRESLLLEKNALDESISSLRDGLANNRIQYTDKNGNLITTTSSSTRKSLESQLETATQNREKVNLKLEAATDSITKLDLQVLNLETDSDLAGELGPLKYISGLTGVPMDKIINYLLLAIVFVFDPLAISLVIAANFAFEELAKKYPKPTLDTPEDPTPTKKPLSHKWPGAVEVFEIEDEDEGDWIELEIESFHTPSIDTPEEVVEDNGFWTEEEMQDFNEQLNADDLLPDEDEWEEVTNYGLEDELNVFEEVFGKETQLEEVKEVPKVEPIEEPEEVVEEIEEEFYIIPELTPEVIKVVDDWDYVAEHIELKETPSLPLEELKQQIQSAIQTSPEILKLIGDSELAIESSSLLPIKFDKRPEEMTEEEWIDSQKRRIHSKNLRDNYGYIPRSRGSTGILVNNI